MWTKFQNGVHRLTFYASVMGMTLLIPLMLLTTGDVIGRSFFRKPIPGSFELSEFLLAIFILLGAAYTQQVKGHVGVDFVTSRLAPRTRAICEIITGLFALFIIAIVMWMGFLEGIHEKTVSDQLRIPQYPFRLLVSVGGFLLWIELLIDLVNSIGKLWRREK